MGIIVGFAHEHVEVVIGSLLGFNLRTRRLRGEVVEVDLNFWAGMFDDFVLGWQVSKAGGISSNDYAATDAEIDAWFEQQEILSAMGPATASPRITSL